MMAPEHPLLDFLKREYELRSDRALCDALGVTPPVISRIRARRCKVSAELIIIIHKKTGMSIEDIEDLIEEKKDDNS
jgi:plasmid maintenance system antidote protein VapI